MTDRFDTGLATRRAVLGDEHVAKASGSQDGYDRPYQDLITEGAWGTVWARPDLTHRERSIVTLALLAGLGNLEEVALHVRASANTGATPQDVMEAMLHVAIYAGVPRANAAIKVVKATYEEMGVALA